MVYFLTVTWSTTLLILTEARLKPNRTRPTTTTTITFTTTEATTTTETTTMEKPIDPLLAPKKAIIEETFPATMVFLAGGGALIFVTIFCLILICCRQGGAPDTRTNQPRGKKRRPHSRGTRSSTSSVSDSAPRAKKIEAEKINMMEFADRGALVMQDVKGEVKHALDNVKSKEIVRVQYDTGQNEIVTIGSEVEIIKSCAPATGAPEEPKTSKKTQASQKSKVV
ncbi:hypothetical protein Y032_0073g762 [Ancylostoma ceylanicum]|uniref:Uncharacterized protein n=1 Tax=Ancylostoma ceylanicum TaxID=53326 RepID=A0A016TVW9_9BILA|nr:hypothetical protein Y032_0073g762 [Ancylostoma ceylanicum]